MTAENKDKVSFDSTSLKIQHPSTVLVAGPTGCGKTWFVVRALRDNLITPAPQRIIWVYGEWQDIYDRMQHSGLPVKFVKDFSNELYNTIDGRERVVVILDDQMMNENVRKKDELAKFFTQGSHHRNLTVIYLVQNVFDKAKCMRNISLNSHYMVLFKNPRDAAQIYALSRQMYPSTPNLLVEAYKDATQVPYGYLFVDLKQETPEQLRLRTKVFDKEPVAYTV